MVSQHDSRSSKKDQDWTELVKQIIPYIRSLVIQKNQQSEVKSIPDFLTTETYDSKEQALPLQELIDEIATQAAKADTSMDIQELEEIMNKQPSLAKHYQSWSKRIPQLQELTLALINAQKILTELHNQFVEKKITFATQEFQEYINQTATILKFKKTIKTMIKKLNTHQR